MADNHLFPKDEHRKQLDMRLGRLLVQHDDLHRSLADTAEGSDQEVEASHQIDDNGRQLVDLVGLRGLYGIVHIASEALAVRVAEAEVSDEEEQAVLNAVLYESGRIGEIALTTLMTGGGPAVFERKGFRRPGEE